jgi:hypothetical protein
LACQRLAQILEDWSRSPAGMLAAALIAERLAGLSAAVSEDSVSCSSRRIRGNQVHRDRDHRPGHPGLPGLVRHPGLQQLSRPVDAREDGPFEPATNPADRNQTLLEELVWSAALIGAVVAFLIAFLVLVVRFAS